MNKSDSERMASRLEQNGYEKTDNKYQANLVVVNTCGVRQMAEDRIYGLIPEIKKVNKKAKVILTGCLVKRQDVKRRLKDYVDEWLSINEILNFPRSRQDKQFSIFKQFSNPNFQTNANTKYKNNYLKIQPKYESKFSAFVPIGNGCNNFCSYCVVPYARGREVYRLAKDVLAEVKNLVKKNYKEVTLIAQNVNSYKSGKIDFAGLLRMVNSIPGDFWIRFMTNHPKDMSDKLIKTVANCKKACYQIHLPAQAGDDSVLKKMNRGYVKADYIKLAEKIRKQLNSSGSLVWQPPVAITTDIIVGFPGETKKQFNNTIKLMRKVKFDLAYIVRYSPRPGTAAFKLADNVPREEKKRRELELIKILRKTALENNKKYLGKIVKALVEKESKNEEWVGKTGTNKNVKFSPFAKASEDKPITNDKISLIGKFVDVKIIKAQDFGLEGKIMNYESNEK